MNDLKETCRCRYHVLARYEAGYRFSSPFRIDIYQPVDAVVVLLSQVAIL